MSKPILYTFPMSVWATVPELALVELGYSHEDIEKKVVNLVEGENFRPSFLKVNPNATLPTLSINGENYTTTASVTSYLVQNAKVQIKSGSELIKKIHEDAYDPNFPMLLARNDAELNAKAAGFPLGFLSNRQNALGKHSVHKDAADFGGFYKEKIASNGELLAIYQSEVPEAAKKGFFEKSKRHWESLRSFITEVLPEYLPEHGFIGGVQPGEDDFHVAAWLARIAVSSGAKQTNEGLQALEKEFSTEIPEKVASYWNAWGERQSWKEVYEGALH